MFLFQQGWNAASSSVQWFRGWLKPCIPMTPIRECFASHGEQFPDQTSKTYSDSYMGHSRSFYSSQFLSDCFQPMFHWWVRYSCFPGICLWTRFGLKTCLVISNQKNVCPKFFSWDSLGVSVKNLETKKTAQLVRPASLQNPGQNCRGFEGPRDSSACRALGPGQVSTVGGARSWGCGVGSWVRRVGGLEGWLEWFINISNPWFIKILMFSCNRFLIGNNWTVDEKKDLSTLAIMSAKVIKRCKVAPFTPKNISWTHQTAAVFAACEVPNAVCGCVDLGSDLPKNAKAAELLKRCSI